MSADREKALARFLADVKDHRLTVIHEDGVHRHLRFQKPGTMCMHFDLITWPGYLCYTGDMGTYVFTRIHDMLEFFRGGKPDNLFYSIDRRYWAEKVEAQDKGAGLKEFSEAKFTRAVMEYLVEWIRARREETTKEERRELWDAVIDEVVRADGDSDGMRKQIAANDFHHRVDLTDGTHVNFYFQDFWERNVEEWTHRFTWCCYALRWAVHQYDTHKEAQAATEGAEA